MLNLPPRCSCRANTQQQQQHPAVCTGHSSTRIARHTYAVYEARFLRKYPVYEYQQSVVCTVACILPTSCTVAVARTRSRSSSLYRMLLCTCSSYTGICVTRLDVYVYHLFVSLSVKECTSTGSSTSTPHVSSRFVSSTGGGVLCMYVPFFCNTPPTCNHHLQLRLFCAITMHRSQDQTLDKAVIDLGQRRPVRGILSSVSVGPRDLWISW